MKKINKVAIFHCGFIYSGGGERIVLEEAKGLRKRGFDVEVFAPCLDGSLCFPKDLKELKVKTFLPQLPSFVPGRHAMWMVLSSLLAPFLAIRFRDVDVFIGANQPGAWIAFCVSKVLGKPYFTYINQPNRLLYHRKIDEETNWQNLNEYYFIDNLIKRLRKFVAWADKISFTSGTAMLADGDYIGKVIEKVYGHPVKMCPAGAVPQELAKLRINPHTAYTGSIKIKNLKGKVFEIRRPFIFLTNRHVPQKKFEYAIEALKIVVKKYPDIQLVIPSSFTPYTKKLQTLVKKLGLVKNVLFLGQISESTLQNLYRNSALYVYTSPEEDFGMGVIEAMGWGVPVVAWDYAGPTVTVVNKKTGFLAKPYDVNDFADKMLEALKDPKFRAKLGKQGWERVREKFSWERHNQTLTEEITAAVNMLH